MKIVAILLLHNECVFNRDWVAFSVTSIGHVIVLQLPRTRLDRVIALAGDMTMCHSVSITWFQKVTRRRCRGARSNGVCGANRQVTLSRSRHPPGTGSFVKDYKLERVLARGPCQLGVTLESSIQSTLAELFLIHCCITMIKGNSC